MKPDWNILVTGGAGFIGSNFIRYALARPDFRGKMINLDKLTYAGNKRNLEGLGPRHIFVKGDICDRKLALRLIRRYKISCVVNFAAESHVDRSIHGPAEFIRSNINGPFSLLEAARGAWEGRKDVRFHQVSTDEVYGTLGRAGKFSETSPYSPRSPYSASKAAADHLALAYFHTYGLPVTISNCSNNYGPYQFPEKLIPLTILNALEGKPLPVYGDGKHVRDWLYVGDHCAALWRILRKGRPGRTYNAGGNSERRNIDVVRAVCAVLEKYQPSCCNGRLKGRKYADLVTLVRDRSGHDRRYAMDFSRLRRELGWRPSVSFQEGLEETVVWYLGNYSWLRDVKTGAYRSWLRKNYSK